MKKLKLKFLIFLVIPFIGYICTDIFYGISQKSKRIGIDKTNASIVRRVEAVAALGQLTPLGEVRQLAAPVSGMGGTPRIAELLVNEGDLVSKGQILARFDNRTQIFADLKVVQARINTLALKIEMYKSQVSRYKKASLQGAAALVLLEEKQDQLINFQGQKAEAMAELMKLEADFAHSELKSPINGIVLRIRSRAGERPGVDGVLEVGDNQSMEALIEVYESDINRVKIGQFVSLTSENGGFGGTLNGKVKRISPQVRQRRVLSTDPTGDADARIVEVRVTLEGQSAELVRELTGMKVIARFRPL